MDGATCQLVERCEAQASEPVQESIARLLAVYDDASALQRRILYERALYLQHGLLLEAVRFDPDARQQLQLRSDP